MPSADLLVKEFKGETNNLTRADAITGTPHYTGADAWWLQHDSLLSAPPLSLPSQSLLTIEMAERSGRLSVSKTIRASSASPPFTRRH